MPRAPWQQHTGLTVPLDRAHIDTDQIIPKQFLKGTGRDGYGAALFYDWRHDARGQPRPDFILNRPQFATASILLAGEDFGCGSSREHAAWALTGAGFRAVIAPSFADIFAGNAARNGLVAAVVSNDALATWMRLAAATPLQLTVDLERKTITAGAASQIRFEIPEFHRRCLLQGLDEIELALAQERAIAAFEANRECGVSAN